MKLSASHTFNCIVLTVKFGPYDLLLIGDMSIFNTLRVTHMHTNTIEKSNFEKPDEL